MTSQFPHTTHNVKVRSRHNGAKMTPFYMKTEHAQPICLYMAGDPLGAPLVHFFEQAVSPGRKATCPLRWMLNFYRHCSPLFVA